MELIQKQIKLSYTTGITETCTGTCRIYIPNTATTYNIQFLLKSKALDLGFFDVYVSGETTTNPEPDVPPSERTAPDVQTGTVIAAEEGGSFNIFSNNKIVNDGNVTVSEYGIIYTYDNSFGNADDLILENEGSFVKVTKTTLPPTTIPFTYSRKLIATDVFVYYRAFAINAEGVGYGLVKSGAVTINSGFVPRGDGREGLEPTTTTTTTRRTGRVLPPPEEGRDDFAPQL